MHCVDLGESFPTSIYLQNLASIQPRTSLVKFARSPRTIITDRPGAERRVQKARLVGPVAKDLVRRMSVAEKQIRGHFNAARGAKDCNFERREIAVAREAALQLLPDVESVEDFGGELAKSFAMCDDSSNEGSTHSYFFEATSAGMRIHFFFCHGCKI